MNATAVFRILTVIFIFILILIIAAANLGLARELFAPIYSFPHGDVVGHFALMGTLSLLVSLGFPTQRTQIGPLHLLRGSLILLGLITLEELSQIFLDNRSFSLLDLSANYAGILLFGELGAQLRKIIR